MNTNAISPLQQLQQISSLTLQDPLSQTLRAGTEAADTSGISPAARFLNQLSELQQQNPDQFSQAITQITARLKQAAQEASNSGNSQRADQLNQLATAFQTAASGGQLPTAQQLQQAGFGGQHHHGGHHHHGGGHANLLNAIQAQSSDSDSNSVLASIFSPASPTQAS